MNDWTKRALAALITLPFAFTLAGCSTDAPEVPAAGNPGGSTDAGDTTVDGHGLGGQFPESRLTLNGEDITPGELVSECFTTESGGTASLTAQDATHGTIKLMLSFARDEIVDGLALEIADWDGAPFSGMQDGAPEGDWNGTTLTTSGTFTGNAPAAWDETEAPSGDTNEGTTIDVEAVIECGPPGEDIPTLASEEDLDGAPTWEVAEDVGIGGAHPENAISLDGASVAPSAVVSHCSLDTSVPLVSLTATDPTLGDLNVSLTLQNNQVASGTVQVTAPGADMPTYYLTDAAPTASFEPTRVSATGTAADVLSGETVEFDIVVECGTLDTSGSDDPGIGGWLDGNELVVDGVAVETGQVESVCVIVDGTGTAIVDGAHPTWGDAQISADIQNGEIVSVLFTSALPDGDVVRAIGAPDAGSEFSGTTITVSSNVVPEGSDTEVPVSAVIECGEPF